MVMRYALLVTLATSAVWGVVKLSAGNPEPYLADAGHTSALGTQGDLSFWLLAAVATLITLSLCRFVVFGLPALVSAWCEGNKTWLYAALAGGAIYGVLYLT